MIARSTDPSDSSLPPWRRKPSGSIERPIIINVRCLMLQALREQVFQANQELVRRGLVLYTFGNASGISRADGLVAIKPSGVPYEQMRPDHLVITDQIGRASCRERV